MHIDKNDFKNFQGNAMDTQDMIAFLEHLDQCSFCLDQFIHEEEETCSLTTPVYLKEQILAKATSPEVKAAKSASDTSRRMQLFYYSLRTAAGVVAALFLLFSVSQIDFTSIQATPSVQTEAHQPSARPGSSYVSDFTQGIGKGISDGAKRFTNYLSDFSNKIVNGGK
ncbi:MAG: hypothetical protein Q4D16_09020 [Eubacteriales bacterium]|nr:hypothetical protein [Eubacteriales bacterium]